MLFVSPCICIRAWEKWRDWCDTSRVSSTDTEMALATSWLILRYLVRMQDTGDRGDTGVGNKVTDTGVGNKETDTGLRNKDKDTLVGNKDRGTGLGNYDRGAEVDKKEREVSTLYEEIQSVKAVLELKVEEVRRLRKELDKRKGWREDKGTMTEKIQTCRDPVR